MGFLCGLFVCLFEEEEYGEEEKEGEGKSGKNEIKRKGRSSAPTVWRAELKAKVSFNVSSRLFLYSFSRCLLEASKCHLGSVPLSKV